MTAFGRPGNRELDLAGFGRTVGLLALALRGFGLAHGNARTIHAEIQGGFYAVRLRLDGLAFVGCDRAPHRFGGPLDLLGVDGEPGQVVQQGAGLLEADSGGRRRRHAGRRGRQRRPVDAQGPVTRTESGSAARAMVVGPLQGHGAQGRAERLCTPAGVARVPTRFVLKYTLRATHLELGGVDLDLAVEDDVLPLDRADVPQQVGVEREVRRGGQA